MIKARIEERVEHYECGDGCCSEWTSYFTVWLGDKKVLEDFEAACEADALVFALKKEGVLTVSDWVFSLVDNDEEYKKL